MIAHDDLIAVLPHLRRYAHAMTRDTQRAEDLMQDTIVRALERAHQFQEGNLRSWCYTIMRRIYLNQARRRKLRAVSIDAVADMPAPSVGDAGLSLRDANAALNRMQRERVEALILAAQGYEYAEIARMMGVPLGTVMSRLARARAVLATTVVPA